MKIFKMCLFSAFILFSCNSNEDISLKIKNFTSFPKSTKKKVILKNFRTKISAYNIFVIDDKLVVYNVWVDNGYYISFFNKNTLEFLGAAAKKGKAPNEIINCEGITTNACSKKIFIIDFGRNNSVYELDVEKSINNKNYFPEKLNELGADKEFVDDLTYCGNDILMFHYYHPEEDSAEYYYNFIGKTDKFSVAKEKLPFVKDFPMNAYRRFSMRKSFYKNGRLFTAFQYHDKIFSYDVKSKKAVFETNGPYLLKPEVELHDIYWVPYETERTVAYISIAASDKYVYGLYSGQQESAKNYSPNCAKTIHVFDYSGNPVQKIELDQNIMQITYDEETNSLVGIQNDEKTGMNTQGLVWIKL